MNDYWLWCQRLDEGLVLVHVWLWVLVLLFQLRQTRHFPCQFLSPFLTIFHYPAAAEDGLKVAEHCHPFNFRYFSQVKALVWQIKSPTLSAVLDIIFVWLSPCSGSMVLWLFPIFLSLWKILGGIRIQCRGVIERKMFNVVNRNVESWEKQESSVAKLTAGFPDQLSSQRERSGILVYFLTGLWFPNSWCFYFH